MLKTTFFASLGAAVLVGLPLSACADSAHDEKGHESVNGGHRGGHEKAIPKAENLADAWSALMAVRDAVAHAIERGDLNDIHAKVGPIPKLMDDVLSKSGDLDPARRARVEGAAKQMARLADALHDAADGGDAARTRKELSRLDGLLELIRAQYPPGALDTGAHREHGHEDHSVAPGDAHGAHAHGKRPTGVVDAVARATVRVRALDQLRFEPRRIEIRAGVPTRIELVNVGVAEHSLVVKTPDGEQDWVHIHVAPGATEAAIYQLDEAGTYPVLCTIPGHTEDGMIGELVVTAGHGGGHSHP